jgi:hypothetical protein
MLLVINSKGLVWDGLGWAEQGREFLSVASATRSLYEEGEDLTNVKILSSEEVT